MNTTLEETITKDLKIEDNKSAYYLKEENGKKYYAKLEFITANDIKKLLKNAYIDDNFYYDNIDSDTVLPNPVENVIYRHIITKITDIRSKREASIKEHNNYFSKLLEQYKIENN